MSTIHQQVLCIWCSKYQFILSPCTGHLFTPRSASELTDMLGLQISDLTFIFINDFGTASQLDFISFYPHIQEGHWSDARLFNVVSKHVNMSVHAMEHRWNSSRLAFHRLQRLRPKGWGTVNVQGGCVASYFFDRIIGVEVVMFESKECQQKKTMFFLWCHSMKASAWFRHVHLIRCQVLWKWHVAKQSKKIGCELSQSTCGRSLFGGINNRCKYPNFVVIIQFVKMNIERFPSLFFNSLWNITSSNYCLKQVQATESGRNTGSYELCYHIGEFIKNQFNHCNPFSN